jgi:hypothetical protein
MFAVMYERNNVLELLLEKGADLHFTDWDGSAPADIVSQQISSSSQVRIL